MNYGVINEEVKKRLESLVNTDDEVVMPEASMDYLRKLVASFNSNREGCDIVRLFKAESGYIAKLCKKPQSTKSSSLKLMKLKKIGDSCVLSGNIKSLRSCVCRHQKKANLLLSNRVIDGDLHVIVIKEN